MDSLNIRLIQKEDLQDLAKIYCKVYTIFDVGEEWDEKSAYNLLDYWYKRQPDLCFLAEIDNKIIGAFVVGIKPWWDGNHLVDGEIFIDPDYQKRGIGTKLSKVLYKTAIEKYNVTYFNAITFKNTFHPLNWYKKQGFKELKNWINISGNLKNVLKNLK